MSTTTVAVVEHKDAVVEKGTNLKKKEDAALTPEVITDEFGDLEAIAVADVIDKARNLNNQVAGAKQWIADKQKALLHDYWHFGRLCAYLFQRGEPRGWGTTVDKIGCSKSHADTARKFYSRVTEDKLDQYRSKTAALRDLGLLPQKPKDLEGKKPEDKPVVVRDKPKKMRIPSTWAQPVVKTIRWIEESDRFNEADLEALEALAAKIEEIRARAAAKA